MFGVKALVRVCVCVSVLVWYRRRNRRSSSSEESDMVVRCQPVTKQPESCGYRMKARLVLRNQPVECEPRLSPEHGHNTDAPPFRRRKRKEERRGG